MKTFDSRVKENLANVITIIGLVAAIWLLVMAINNPEQLLSIFLLAGIVSISDFIDGRLARKFNASTEFGSILDRIRDRMFVYPSLIILTWHHRWKLTDLPFQTITGTLTKAAIIGILIMEILLFIACCIGIIWYLGGTKISLSPNKWGSKKTFSGFLVVLIWLFSLMVEKYFGFSLIKISIFVIDLGLILMIYWGYKSLLEYCKRGEE